MKTMKYALGILLAGMLSVNGALSQVNADSLIACKAFRSLKSANVLNGITIALGTASNIEMMAIGGFPLEVDDGLNPQLNISHMFLALGRVGTSIVPPFAVMRARHALKPWRNSPDMASSCEKLFSNLDAAQVFSVAAPVLCITGGVMMLAASTSYEVHHYYRNGQYEETTTMSRPGLKTIGWIFVGTGLASSVTSAILIGICKQELAAKIGTFKVAVGSSGLGLQYNFPVQK